MRGALSTDAGRVARTWVRAAASATSLPTRRGWTTRRACHPRDDLGYERGGADDDVRVLTRARRGHAAPLGREHAA